MDNELLPGAYWRAHKSSGFKTIIEVIERDGKRRVRSLGETGAKIIDDLVMDGYYHERIEPPKTSDILGISYQERYDQLVSMTISKQTLLAQEIGINLDQHKTTGSLIKAILKEEGFRKIRKPTVKTLEA